MRNSALLPKQQQKGETEPFEKRLKCSLNNSCCAESTRKSEGHQQRKPTEQARHFKVWGEKKNLKGNQPQKTHLV